VVVVVVVMRDPGCEVAVVGVVVVVKALGW